MIDTPFGQCPPERGGPRTTKPESMTRTTVGKIEINGRLLRFATPTPAATWRVETFFTKEPETIEWLDSFSEGDTLVDVGANAGMYSIYSAVKSKSPVFAFEPESQNFALLNYNIYLNQLDDRIKAIPVAISNGTGLDDFHLSYWGAAGSCHAAGPPIGYDGNAFRPKFSQATYKIRLDEISTNLLGRQAIHLKVDVDGIEPQVISGAEDLLSHRAFSSVLVEINHNLDSHINIIRKMLTWGYQFDPAQVSKSMRKTGPFAGVANYVFRQ